MNVELFIFRELARRIRSGRQADRRALQREYNLGEDRSEEEDDALFAELSETERAVFSAPFPGARSLAVKARLAEQYLPADGTDYAFRAVLDGVYQLAKVKPPEGPDPYTQLRPMTEAERAEMEAEQAERDRRSGVVRYSDGSQAYVTAGGVWERFCEQ